MISFSRDDIYHREMILFKDDYDLYAYDERGERRFTDISVDKLDKLVDLGFLDPDDSVGNSPKFSVMMDFMRRHPEVTAHGFALLPFRDFPAVKLTGIMCRDGLDEETLEDFNASGFDDIDMYVEMPDGHFLVMYYENPGKPKQKALNYDLRDQILFREDYNPDHYHEGTVREFEPVSLGDLETLVSLGFLDPDALSVSAMKNNSEILDMMRQHPGSLAAGYVFRLDSGYSSIGLSGLLIPDPNVKGSFIHMDFDALRESKHVPSYDDEVVYTKEDFPDQEPDFDLREQILFHEDFDADVYEAEEGRREFENLSLFDMRRLANNGLLDINDRRFASISAAEIMEFMQEIPASTAFGYAMQPAYEVGRLVRHRVTVTGIEVPDPDSVERTLYTRLKGRALFTRRDPNGAERFFYEK